MDFAKQMQRKIQRECKSKHRYPNRSEAENSVKQYNAASAPHGGTILRAYECIWCRGWHRTSKDT